MRWAASASLMSLASTTLSRPLMSLASTTLSRPLTSRTASATLSRLFFVSYGFYDFVAADNNVAVSTHLLQALTTLYDLVAAYVSLKTELDSDDELTTRMFTGTAADRCLRFFGERCHQAHQQCQRGRLCAQDICVCFFCFPTAAGCCGSTRNLNTLALTRPGIDMCWSNNSTHA